MTHAHWGVHSVVAAHWQCNKTTRSAVKHWYINMIAMYNFMYMFINGIYSTYSSGKTAWRQHLETKASTNHLEGDWTHLLTAKSNWANGISALPVETVGETTAVGASGCTRLDILLYDCTDCILSTRERIRWQMGDFRLEILSIQLLSKGTSAQL